jgi:hypothetical protein
VSDESAVSADERIAITPNTPKPLRISTTAPGPSTGRCGSPYVQMHDPTEENRHGVGRGIGYSSTVVHRDDHHQEIALDTNADIDAPKLRPGSVVTGPQPATNFREADHQDHLEHYPIGHTCHCVRPGWRPRDHHIVHSGTATATWPHANG